MSWKRSNCTYGLFALAIGAAASCPTSAQTPPPAATCPVTNFSSWQGPSTGGALNFVPPNSATFSPTGLCSFYQWASQMFLWLTSTDPAGNMIVFSPTFYTAVENSSGGFSFVQNTEGDFKTGLASNRLAAGVVSKSLFHVRVNRSKESPSLLLKQNAEAAAGHPQPAGATGQAGGGGALIVNGQAVAVPGNPQYATYPIVYYTIQVNDVYAGLADNFSKVNYFNNGPNTGNFPLTTQQVQQIAQAAGVPSYSDQDQLALEVKSAWVDIAYLPPQVASSNLLTITAEVPAFQQSVQNGLVVLTSDGTVTTQRTLALVGMHVVGTVANHPEMVWATFETTFNAPDANYAYVNNSSNITTVSLSDATASSNPYVFYNGNEPTSVAPSGITITATSSGGQSTTSPTPKEITAITFTSATTNPSALPPTSAVRLNPWGNTQPSAPTVSDPVTSNNTLLLSLKTSLDHQLDAAGKNGDVLANYMQTGALWTNGVVPTGNPSELPQFGSTALANTTMETFQQFSPGGFTQAPSVQPAANCFSCHSDFSGPGATISHVFP